MPNARSVVDYSLARRAALADLRAGRLTRAEACDAHPYLLRAARYYGEPTGTPCPVCRDEQRGRGLHHVTYVFGEELGEGSGRARTRKELAGLAACYGTLRVFVVEVCRSCGWNHLVSSAVMGTGTPQTGRRRVNSRLDG